MEQMQVADGYDALMFARAVKTETEMRLIERATALNEAAIRRTVARAGTEARRGATSTAPMRAP
jgi:Xaa-Pro aminopeptidase